MDIHLSHADLWCSALVGALCGMAWAWAMFMRQADHDAGSAFDFARFCWPVLTGAAVGLVRRMHAHDILSLWGAVDRIGGIGMVFVGLLILQRHALGRLGGSSVGILTSIRGRLAAFLAPPPAKLAEPAAPGALPKAGA